VKFVTGRLKVRSRTLDIVRDRTCTDSNYPAFPAGRPGVILMCQHGNPCPDAASEARDLAAVVSSHPEQGWSLLCNGVVLFDDDGELLPDGRAVDDHHTWLRPERELTSR
jgi:hypothetical protein